MRGTLFTRTLNAKKHELKLTKERVWLRNSYRSTILPAHQCKLATLHRFHSRGVPPGVSANE
jgi:hypothetical protein